MNRAYDVFDRLCFYISQATTVAGLALLITGNFVFSFWFCLGGLLIYFLPILIPLVFVPYEILQEHRRQRIIRQRQIRKRNRTNSIEQA